jgi:hypothetical protein
LRLTDPRRFALVLAVPETAAEFRSLDDSTPRDLARLVPWPVYEEKDLPLIDLVSSSAEKLGVKVYRHARATEWPVVFDGVEVVTLIAHAVRVSDDPDPVSIEFVDEQKGNDSVIMEIPAGFDGCIDLMSCFSNPVADKIRWARPRSVLCSVPGLVWLGDCLRLYAVVLAAIHDKRVDYIAAIGALRSQRPRRLGR